MRVGLVVKPEIRGSDARATTVSKSAPSPKMEMLYSGGTGHPRRVSHDPPFRLAQAGRDRVRADWLFFVVAAVHEHGSTADPLAGFDVAPAITNHVTPPEIETEVGRSPLEQAGLWLAAPAVRSVVMGAQVDRVKSDQAPQAGVD